MLLLLIAIQLTLGALTVLSLKAVDITTAHVATGALLLATSLALSLRLLKVFGFPKRQTDVSLSAREVTA